MTTYAKIRAALYAALPLLVLYGLVSEEEAAAWAGAILAIVDAVLALVHLDTGETSGPLE